MNLLHKAGLALALLGAATAANAQPGRDHRHDDGRRFDHRGDWHDRGRHDWRDHGRHDWRDHGRHYGWRNHGRHCRTEWRHHHHVRSCR